MSTTDEMILVPRAELLAWAKAKLAAHVRPTCGELWAEAERLLNRTAPPSAHVGVEVVRRVAENIRANLDSLPSIARVWADDLDQALAAQQGDEA